MKFIEEFRDPELIKTTLKAIQDITTKPWRIMEICGGQTHSILKFGLQELIPPAIQLLHGPGCPVCVTPLIMIEKAVYLASQPGIIFCSFGDMLRVPGMTDDLLSIKARGCDIRMVYSPLDTLQIAIQNPHKQVIFFAIGFETTAPAVASTLIEAKHRSVSNLTLLVSHVLVPPAIKAVLSSPENRVQGFLAAGHVCTVMGFEEYERLAIEYSVPMIVTGFEPLDLLQGIFLCVDQLESNRAEAVNQYARSVKRQGNIKAREIINQVFQVVDREWRGIGTIPKSGLVLKPEFDDFDAEQRFPIHLNTVREPDICISGKVLQGIEKPDACPAFGQSCTPEHPIGATMVSSEGACAAYYRYGRVHEK